MGVKQLEISPCVLNLIKMILGNPREIYKFYLGVAGGSNFIQGYAGGFESDLGVRKYQKVENP